MSHNIIEKCNDALWNKTFGNGLSKYTQTNCQVTLTDTGYRIYRPPNLVRPDAGNTMWGGLILQPLYSETNALQKDHSYVIRFELKGQTSNSVSSVYWSNNAGWSGGGLNPNPTNIVQTAIPANWVSTEWVTYQYRFSIPDDIYKVCTQSYSSFVEGNTYPSYRDFKFGFDYTNTGELGTDLYLRNFKLYDITTITKQIDITKCGVTNSGNFTENTGNVSLKSDGDCYANQFYEI